MKKKNKIIIMLLIILCTTGCSIKYDINIKNNSVEETISVTDTEINGRTKEDILNHYNLWYPAYTEDSPEYLELDFKEKYDNIEYHQKNIQEIQNGYKYTYKYIYTFNTYQKASSITKAYQRRNFYVGDDYVSINTSAENLLFNYPYFESIDINITIDPNYYSVKNTNTENISNNTYTWNITKDNYKNSEIILIMDKIEKEETNIPSNDNIQNQNNQKDNNKRNDYTMYIFSAILLIVMLTGYLIFNKIKNNNDKMDV